MLLLLIINSLSVIFLKKPVYAVLALVGVFIETGIVFLTFGAEFMAVLLITVYVGAIAILFLFVVMMLDLRLVDLHGTTYYSFPVGAFLGIWFILIIGFYLQEDIYNYLMLPQTENDDYLLVYDSNIKALGQVLYNWYIDFVVIVSLVLLIAMIGVIVITIDYDKKPASPTIEPITYRNNTWSNILHCYSNK